tara:strand:+ start:2740 stop:2988 length:249 start_codon:yes stop_codon:yes gene_type:complete
MAKKISKKELENLRGLLGKINQNQIQIGVLEVQKSEAVDTVKALRQQVIVVQGDLEKKYGPVNVNIQDGTITERDGDVNKKN